MTKNNSTLKKTCSIVTSLVIALSLFFSMTTITAFATEVTISEIGLSSVLTPSSINSKVVHYPISGTTSGYFVGQECSNKPKFELPSGTLYISYSFDAPSTGTMKITGQGNSYAITLIPDGNPHTKTVEIDTAGTYQVSLSTLMGSGSNNQYYAFNFYTYN